MLVHLAALARVAWRGESATPDERELLMELEGLLGLTLLDVGAGTLTAAALSLAPAAVATLATANTFFDSAEGLSVAELGVPPEQADAAAMGPQSVDIKPHALYVVTPPRPSRND